MIIMLSGTSWAIGKGIFLVERMEKPARECGFSSSLAYLQVQAGLTKRRGYLVHEYIGGFVSFPGLLNS